MKLLIGQSSTEGERKKRERSRLQRQKLLPSGGVDICPPNGKVDKSLHPETKRGGDRSKRTKCPSAPVKSFADDTADKWGVDPRTVRREIQTAKNLTTEAKTILRDSDTKLTKKDALSLSRLTPEQQREAASRLAAGDIDSVNEYQPPPAVLGPVEPEPPVEAPPPSVPYSSSGRHFATFEESIADLKNPDKDCSYTPDSLLAELDSFIEKFHREFACRLQTL